MAPVSGKLVRQTNIKSGGDVFHEIFTTRPHHLNTMSPDKVQGCDLHDGEFGTVGSIICWSYVHEGKAKKAKQVIEAIDEENKTIVFKMLEGDLMEIYTHFIITTHVDTKGEDNVITWTVEYEKPNEDVEDPHTLMDFFIEVTKDIETHHK